MIGLQVPEEAVRNLLKLSVPGKKVSEDSYHITMFYFEKDLNIDNILKVTKCLYESVRSLDSFSIKGAKVINFPKGEDGYPIVVKVESEDLLELRKKIAKKLGGLDIKYSKKFPEYKPHITLSYSPKEAEEKSVSIKWKASEITLWGGNHHEEQLMVDVPFRFGKTASRFDLVDMYTQMFEKFSG